MTTSQSPLRVLKAQADKIATTVKAIERGEEVVGDHLGKIVESKARGIFKFAVVMDDKIVTLEMAWATIAASSEVGLSEYVLKLMRGTREATH